MSEDQTTANYALGHLDHPAVRHRYGKILTRAAWGIEIIAASIGLFIALATIFATQSDILEEQGNVDAQAWMNIFIAALPFFMVAIVELMKIPLATAYYIAQSRVWRWIFLAALIFLIAVTFETMINGFQRQFESRVFLITEDRTKLTNIEESISRLDSRVAELREITVANVTSDHEAELAQIREERESAIANLESLRREQIEQAGLTETGTQEAEIARIQSQIVQLRESQNQDIRALQESYNADASRSAEEAEAQRAVLSRQLEALDNQISRTEEEYARERDGCVFSCESVDNRFAERLNPLRAERRAIASSISNLSSVGSGQNLRSEFDARIAEVRDRYERLISEQDARARELARIIDDRTSRSADKIQPIIEQIDARRAEVIDESRAEVEASNTRFRERLVEAENREELVAGIQSQKGELEIQRNDLRNQINLRAKDNQIYQIASLWFGKDAPVDVTKEELKLISTIWFGSLAAIVALTGTILAFAGLVVRYHEPKRRNAWRSVRAAAVALRQSLRKRIREGPRVVTKEVPVDKIVFRDVEREVVRKDLVYVPLYTNDPELLQIWDGISPIKGDADDLGTNREAASGSDD